MSPDQPVYLLDSFAVLAYLNGETGKDRVVEVLELARQGQCRLLLSLLNLGEVLYIVERRRGLKQAQFVLAVINTLPVEQVEVSRAVILDAAHIKAGYPVSYADAVAVAVAQHYQATILTGDPEFKTVEAIVPVDWLL